MRVYPNQPLQVADADETRTIIKEILDEDLPECSTNEWFLYSVNFANMVDKIVERLGNEAVCS